MELIDCGFFCSLILIFVVVGVSKRTQTESAYLFANRKTKWFALTATLVMTEFNSATLIAFSSLGYAAGFWALTLPFVFLIGLLFYALVAAKKWKEYNGTSVAGFFTEKYGKRLGTSTSTLLLLAMLGFSAAYIKSLTLLFQPLFPQMHGWFVSGLLVTIILAMGLRGGLIAIIRTDVLSLCLMLLFFPLLALFMWKAPSLPPLTDTLLASHEILPMRFVFSLILLTMFTYILAPWYGQKIFAAQSKKIAYWSVVASALLIFLLYGSAIAATALFRYRGFEAPSWEQALPTLINRCLPSGIRGCAYALLFATSATTLTGVWNAMSAMWIGDFSKSRSIDSKQGIVVTLVLAAITYLCANLFVDRVFDKLILANIPVAALSFGLLAGFYWKQTTLLGVYVSIIVGCLMGVGAYLVYGEAGGYTWYWAVYGIPLTFISGILCSIIVRSPLTSAEKSKSHSSN